MGKVRNITWQYFRLTEKQNVFACMFCNKEYKQNVTRMNIHLTNCIQCPLEIKRDILKQHPKYERENIPSSPLEQHQLIKLINTSSSTSMSLENSTHRQTVCDSTDKTSDNEKKILDQKLAHAIYTSGCPYWMVENNEWQDFFHQLRPSYKLPTRDEISTRLSKEELNSVRSKILCKIKSSDSVTIQCDGWTNTGYKPIINFVVSTPDPVLYKTLCTDNVEGHTDEYIADAIIKCITEIGPHKVSALISDNTVAMENAKRIVLARYDYIISYSCACHTLNLIMQDIMKLESLINIECVCKDIGKEINGSHQILTVFREIQRNQYRITKPLHLTQRNRFRSILKCIESLTDTKDALQILVMSQDDDADYQLSQSIKDNILSEESFWAKLDKIEKLLKPIVKWITVFENNSSSSPTISKVYLAVQEIKTALTSNLSSLSLNSNEFKKIMEVFQKREIMLIKPVHLAAQVLDPNFCGASLTSEEHCTAVNFIYKQCSSNPELQKYRDVTISELTNYLAKSDVWKMDSVWHKARISDPISWWKGLFPNTRLKNIAVTILELPSSACSAESELTVSKYRRQKDNYVTTERSDKYHTESNMSNNVIGECPAATCNSISEPGTSNTRINPEIEQNVFGLETSSNNDSRSDEESVISTISIGDESA